MNEVMRSLARVCNNREWLRHLLMLEKDRRGAPRDRLVFVGIADVAQQRWCEQQAVLKSRANELTFFTTYLADRVRFADRLGIINALPTDDDSLLGVGSKITFADVQKLCEEDQRQTSERNRHFSKASPTFVRIRRMGGNGSRAQMVDPDRGPLQRKLQEENAAAHRVRVIVSRDEAMLRGKIDQALRAEKYPTMRWHFPWRSYVVVGMPDGITDEFAYEYKSTRSRSLLSFTKPVAFAQADLYGYFFIRPKKRVQIHVLQNETTETWEEPVDIANAEGTLSAFNLVDVGAIARLPEAWKCNSCEFRASCSISQAK
ncbi:MAG TPA: hypothetical protein VGY55_08710 [Pirellulales bacterium]|jgi:hypothetical protein|nr:hypothetical protein [Pirellulales bacterium]